MPFYTQASQEVSTSLAGIRDDVLPAVRRAYPPETAHGSVSRVAQLDAFLLDDELQNILAAPVLASLSQAVRTAWEPELLLALRITLLHLGLSSTHPKNVASYGAKLQNLAFRHLSSKKRYAYILLSVFPAYAHARMRDFMLVNGWPDYPAPNSLLAVLRNKSPARRRRELKRLGWDALMQFEKLLTASKLINFLLFLYNGRYPSLVARILNLRFSYAQQSVARNVSFEFLNRQLVWEAFTEFLLFLMPLVNIRTVRRWMSQSLYRHNFLSSMYALVPASLITALNLPQPTINSSKARKHRRNASTASAVSEKAVDVLDGPLAHLPLGVCPICHSRAAAPGTADPSAHVVDPVDPTTSTAILATLNTDAMSSAITRTQQQADGNRHLAIPSAYSGQEATVPYKTDCCDTLYCYYCIAGALLEWETAKKEEEAVKGNQHRTVDVEVETGWPCLRCGKAVLEVHRYNAVKVLDSAASAEPKVELQSDDDTDIALIS